MSETGWALCVRKMTINDDGGELEVFHDGFRVTVRGGGVGGTGFDVQMPGHEAVKFAELLAEVAGDAVTQLAAARSAAELKTKP